MTGWRANVGGRRRPGNERWVCKPGLARARLSGTTSPWLASAQPREKVGLVRCSCNLENNFPLVGYCGRPYLEQSC